MSIAIKFEDNSDKILKEIDEKTLKITYAMGLLWQNICSKLITRLKIVDTGRLRASLTFITFDKVGKPINKSPNSTPKDYLNGSSDEKGDLIVGSNVVYAKKQELTNKKGAFIRPSILEYRQDYKNLAEKLWKE